MATPPLMRTDYKKGDPVKKFCSARERVTQNNFLNNLRGVGCRVSMDMENGCLNPRIIIDGSSDEPWPEGFEPGGPGGVAAYPFQLYGRLNDVGVGEVRCRGGSVHLMVGDYTITTLQIAAGDLAAYSDWITSNSHIGIEIDASDADIANWTIAFATWANWPDNETDKIKIRFGTDAWFGTFEPEITQFWVGGDIHIDVPSVLGDTTPNPIGTAAAGTAATASRSDHVHNALLDDIQAADANTELVPDTDDTYTLMIGKTDTPKKMWSSVGLYAVGTITVTSDDIRLISNSALADNTGMRSSGGRVQVYDAGLSGTDDGYATSDGVSALVEFYSSSGVGIMEVHAWTIFRGISNRFIGVLAAEGGITLPDGENIEFGNGDISATSTGKSLNPLDRKGYASGGTTETLNWSSQQPAIADVTGENDTAINSILAALRAYKIIAT